MELRGCSVSLKTSIRRFYLATI